MPLVECNDITILCCKIRLIKLNKGRVKGYHSGIFVRPLALCCHGSQPFDTVFHLAREILATCEGQPIARLMCCSNEG